MWVPEPSVGVVEGGRAAGAADLSPRPIRTLQRPWTARAPKALRRHGSRSPFRRHCAPSRAPELALTAMQPRPCSGAQSYTPTA